VSTVSTTVTAPRHVARACWQNGCADRAVTITRDGKPVALIPLADTGDQPSMATLDDMIATMGFTRIGAWLPAATGGLLADVVPLRPEEGSR
jgi:hypothetical protein